FHLRYPGQRHDPATGLNYNYYRDYDPKTGRYIQSDPIGLEGGISTYGYVEGNPLGGIDPYGLEKWICRPMSQRSATGVIPVVTYHPNGRQTCNYICENTRCGEVMVEASAVKYTDGYQCAGVETRTRPTHLGGVSRYPIGYKDFYVNTGRIYGFLMSILGGYPFDLAEKLREKEVDNDCCR
ncbi:hypothetical protein CO613_07840, partial [Lysobacteraceae bacterium NML07-0707]